MEMIHESRVHAIVGTPLQVRGSKPADAGSIDKINKYIDRGANYLFSGTMSFSGKQNSIQNLYASRGPTEGEKRYLLVVVYSCYLRLQIQYVFKI